jgi:N-acyl-L-homoserine lactone synthetase
MFIRCHADRELSVALRKSIARYRYRVFVESMGWQLPCEDGHEQDEFDTAHATHVVAYHGSDGRIVGYGRLLPTTHPYLLQTHFMSLLNGLDAPRTKSVWELSRYTSADPCNGRGRAPSELESLVGKRVLLEAMNVVASRGASSLVCCTSVAIERLARRWGVPLQRLGPPQRIGQRLLIGGLIEITSEGRDALRAPMHGSPPAISASWHQPLVPPMRTPPLAAAALRAVAA